ncbi:MAG: sigma-70 family RNA polymerase sigma factor [Ferruginibacter sp.]
MNARANEVVKYWIEEFSNGMYAYALARLRHPANARDILQETFIAAWKSYESYNAKASEKTWLYAILKNKIADSYRKKSRQPEELTGDNAWFDEAGRWIPGSFPSPWRGTDALINKKEFHQIFEDCLQKLTGRSREAFILKYIEDQEPAFICKELDISTSNYWVLLHRSKLALRSCLEKHWFQKKMEHAEL